MDYTPAGLGLAIRARRTRIDGLSQRALGEAAGYEGGGNAAAVAMSRIESGRMQPRQKKLELIAQALRVELQTLLDEASAASQDPLPVPATSTQGNTLKERLDAVEHERQHRSRLIDDLGNKFRTAHDDARDRFFLKFLDVAAALSDSPELSTPKLVDGQELLELNRQALYLATLSSGVAVRLGGVGTGGRKTLAADEVALFSALLAGPLNGAAIQAARGLLSNKRGLATMAGASFALPAVVMPAAVLAAVVSQREITRRSKRREAELASKVAAAESALTDTRPGFDALVEALTRATAVLEYIAVHASHAFDRWTSNQPSPLDAESLSGEQTQRYNGFREVAGCQMNIARIDFGALVAVPEVELGPLVDLATDTLNFAQATVEALV